MPTDPADNLLGLIAPNALDNANGPDGFQDIIDGLGDAASGVVGMAKIHTPGNGGVSPVGGQLTLNSIPGDFNHLRLMGRLHATTGATAQKAMLRFNAETANYAYNGTLITTAAGPTRDTPTPPSGISLGNIGSGATRDLAFVVDILSYDGGLRKLVFGKSLVFPSGAPAPDMWDFVGWWNDSDPVNRIDVVSSDPAISTFDSGSVELYHLL